MMNTRMSYFLIWFLTNLFYQNTVCFEDIQPKIIGGKIARPKRHPFMVSIQYRYLDDIVGVEVIPFCGGSILNEYWILTAAHCMAVNDIEDLYIKAGGLNAETSKRNVQIVKVKETFPHPLFSTEGEISEHDIGLLKLAEKLNFTRHIQPIHLPPDGYMPTGSGDILGWGSIEPTAQIQSPKLLKVHVKLLPYQKCKKIYERITENHICPGEPGKSSCGGDSGGPFVQKINGLQTVVGVASYGKRPCGNAPEVYVRVSAYVDNFILPTINKN